jgi:cytochrome oxidase Cu insertion factor (SCO1/SenC/PrrC family)
MKKMHTYLAALLLLANTSFAQTNLTTAVDFTVTTVHGEEFNLFELLDAGKHVIVDFFFTTCPPCIASVPTMNESYEKYGCNKGDIYYISMDAGDTNAEVLQYEADYGGLFPAVSGTEGGGDAVVNAYGIGAFPTVILIAPNRDILSQDIFPVTHANLDAAITGAGISENPDACNESPVGINELDNSVAAILNVFPNPASLSTTVEFSLTEATEITVELSNLMGQKVSTMTTQQYTIGKHVVNVPLANLSNGMYNISLTSSDGLLANTKVSVLR